MHKIVIEELERHLEGRASRAFHNHLAQCGKCRSDVSVITEASALIRGFRTNPEEIPTPPPEFYVRVTGNIVQKQRSSAWGMFAPGTVFFRRVAFASLLLLAGLGSYLITNENEFSVNDATAIIAQGSGPEAGSDAPASAGHRDQILLTLANWSE